MDIRLCDVCLGAQDHGIAQGHGNQPPPEWGKFTVSRTGGPAAIETLACPDCLDLLMSSVESAVAEIMDVTRSESEWIKRIEEVLKP